MIFVTKHIKPHEKKRKERLQELQQQNNHNATDSMLNKLDELKELVKRRQKREKVKKSVFKNNPIGSKVNSFMIGLNTNDTSNNKASIKSRDKKDLSYYRDFYGRKRKRKEDKRDWYGRKVN